MAYGENETLTGGEWLQTLGREVDRAEAAVSAKLEESARAGKLAERLEGKAPASTDPEEIGRLEDEARTARRVEQAAHNEAERITRDVLEPARIARLDGERRVADDEASALSQRAADEKAGFDATPSPYRLRKLLETQAKRNAGLAHSRDLYGDRGWLPPGWADEPDPPADASERAEALTSSYQPAKAAAEKEEAAKRSHGRARSDRRRWLKQQGAAFLKNPANVAGEDAKLVAEVIAELEEELEELVARRRAKGAPLVGA